MISQIKYRLTLILTNIILLFFIDQLSPLHAQTLNVPARSPSAMNGSQFISYITSMGLTARENAIYDEVMAGNVPDFMRNMVAVSSSAVISSTTYTATYYVIPDYMAIGCDSNYFLCPMTPLLAQRIADQIGCTLPTRKMVNDIWSAATVHLSPSPIPPSDTMTEVPVFAIHNSTVWGQRSAVLATHPLGELVGGDKKNVVISNIIYGYPSPGRVVIYGWHYTSGTPIQPLYNGHEETYADYSHGIRMVQLACTLNGSATDVNSILTSSTYNTVLSDEGVIAVPRYPVSMPQPVVPKSFCILNEGASQARITINYDSDNTGYIIQKSSDGLTFTNCISTTDTNNLISGLTNEAITYFRIAAYNNYDTTAWSEVLAVTPSSFNEHVLIVNGFDRTSTGNTLNFIRQHGVSVFNSDYLFSSATNDAITNGFVDLNDFLITDWILGDESTADETFSTAEQAIVASYLDQEGKLFASGSEIAWDLDNKGATSDKNFYHNYLKASYVNDAPNGQSSTYYSATSVVTQFFSSLINFSFDNGTHGTINVKYPDVISELNGSSNCFYYTTLPTNYSGVCFTGIFPNGSDTGKIVNMGIPFETVYPDSSRNKLMGKILEYFEPAPNASFTASGNTTFCAGDSILLNAQQDYGYSYQWIKDGSDIPGESSSSLAVNQSGTYALTVSHHGVSEVSSAVIIIVNPLPIAFVNTTDPTSFCSGDTVLLSASSGDSYQWMLDGAAISGATNSSYSATSQGYYSVMVTENSCSSFSDSTLITVWQRPLANAGNDTSVCAGSSVTLTASGGCNYQWDHSIIQNTPFFPDTSQTYQVIVTNVLGCQNSDSVLVNVIPLPEIPTITQYNHYLLCSDAYSYQWYDSTGILLNDTLQLLAPVSDGWYYVIACDSIGCCSQSGSFYYLSTAIAENTDNLFSYYQLNNSLYLNFPVTNNYNVTLYSIDGNEIYTKEVFSNQLRLDISNLSEGIYLVNILTNDSSKLFKILIQQ
jgi:hypothetical protein